MDKRNAFDTPEVVADLVAEVGRAQLSASVNVIETQEAMRHVAIARGVHEPEVGVFPTFVVYQDRQDGQSRNLIVTPDSLDAAQTIAISECVDQAADPDVPATVVLTRIKAVLSEKTPIGWHWCGYPIAAAGFSLMLGADGWNVLAVVLIASISVGILQLVKDRRNYVLTQLGIAFTASLIATLATKEFPQISSLLVALASVALLIPSALIIKAAQELAGGDMVSGSSRMVYAIVQLLLLAVAIVVGHATVRGLGAGFGKQLPAPSLGTTAVAAIVFVLGIAIYTRTPRRYVPALMLVLAATFIGEQLFASMANEEVGLGVGAAAGLSCAMWLQRRNWLAGPPTQVTFVPAFWTLLPGALVISAIVAEISGREPTTAFSSLFLSMVAILVGCLVGSLLGDSVRAVLRISRRRTNAARRVI